MSDGYERRPIRPLGVHAIGDWRIKVYGISAEAEVAPENLIDAAIAQAAAALREPIAHTHYNVGFLGIHDGQGENQVFLDRWINRNELMHQFWTSAKAAPEKLSVPPPDHCSVCVWDLFVQAYEREAWLKHVLDASNPSIEAYLADQFLGSV